MRVSTSGNYQSALLDLMSAQARGAEAQKRVATQKNATDLSGFGRQSETLTALKGAGSRLQGFIDTSQAVSARLTTQDLALDQVREGASDIREAIENALANESSQTLMLQMENALQSVRGGLNMKHQGSYLFAGAATSTQPLTAETLTDLTAAASVDDVFQNDNLKAASRVADGVTLETGLLADDVGRDTLTVLRNIQAFHAGAGGPLSGKLTEPQKTFLKTQLNAIMGAQAGVVDRMAFTGTLAQKVDAGIDSQEKQKLALDGLVAERTDADVAKALTDLQLSQIAIQASAQLISGLKESSLLNYLR